MDESENKPFFFRVEPGQLLAEIITLNVEQRGEWILQFALDLMAAKEDESRTDLATVLIIEAKNYKKKKVLAGQKGGLAKASSAIAKASSAKVCSSGALAKASIPLASNRSSTEAVQYNTEQEPKDKTLSRANKFDDEDLRFSHWMFELIESLPGNHKEPNFNKWANTVRLMREQDGLSLKAIGSVFKWANSDDFWSCNILSPEKLRSKFSQLSAKALRPAAVQKERERPKTFEEIKMENLQRDMEEFAKGGENAGIGQERICITDG